MEAATPAYPTRLSDAQWAILAVYFAADSQLGWPRKTPLRAVVEAILYVLRASCPWCMLPSDFPPWQTVYGYFRARQRHLAAHSPLLAPVGTASPQAPPVAQRGHRRYAVGATGLLHTNLRSGCTLTKKT